MRALDKVLDICSRISLGFANVCLTCMAVLIFIEIICRSCLGFSTFIADEYSAYLLVGVVFLGLLHTFRGNHFIKMDYFYDRLFSGVNKRKILNIALLIIGIAYLIILTKSAVIMIETSLRLESKSIFISETPLWIPQLVIPIGLVFLLIQMVADLFLQTVEIFSAACKNKEGK